MTWVDCPDPPHRKPCGWDTEEDPQYCWLHPKSGGKLRIRTIPASRLAELGAKDWDILEVAADSRLPVDSTGPGHAFTLRLPPVHPGEDDDIGLVQSWIEWALPHGCRRLLCAAPPGDEAYRYRWLTMVRSLCEEHRLPFNILERPETPKELHLNRFLATKKGCCRWAHQFS